MGVLHPCCQFECPLSLLSPKDVMLSTKLPKRIALECWSSAASWKKASVKEASLSFALAKLSPDFLSYYRNENQLLFISDKIKTSSKILDSLVGSAMLLLNSDASNPGFPKPNLSSCTFLGIPMASHRYQVENSMWEQLESGGHLGRKEKNANTKPKDNHTVRKQMGIHWSLPSPSCLWVIYELIVLLLCTIIPHFCSLASARCSEALLKGEWKDAAVAESRSNGAERESFTSLC